jgi:ketopantoate reductase
VSSPKILVLGAGGIGGYFGGRLPKAAPMSRFLFAKSVARLYPSVACGSSV